MFPIMEEAGVCETSEQPESAGLILMGSPAAIVLLLASDLIIKDRNR